MFICYELLLFIIITAISISGVIMNIWMLLISIITIITVILNIIITIIIMNIWITLRALEFERIKCTAYFICMYIYIYIYIYIRTRLDGWNLSAWNAPPNHSMSHGGSP